MHGVWVTAGDVQQIFTVDEPPLESSNSLVIFSSHRLWHLALYFAYTYTSPTDVRD